MHLFDHRGYTVKAWVAIAPLIGATLIAVSRTMGQFKLSLSTSAPSPGRGGLLSLPVGHDWFAHSKSVGQLTEARADYRHHATDVIAGSILGALIALVTYHLCTLPARSLSLSLAICPASVFPLVCSLRVRGAPSAWRPDYPSLFSAKCHLPFSPRIPPTTTQDRLALESAASGSDGGVAFDNDYNDYDETVPRDDDGGGGGGARGGRNGRVLPLHRGDYSQKGSATAGGGGTARVVPPGAEYSREFGRGARESHDYGGEGGGADGPPPITTNGDGFGGVAVVPLEQQQQRRDHFEPQARLPSS